MNKIYSFKMRLFMVSFAMLLLLMPNYMFSQGKRFVEGVILDQVTQEGFPGVLVVVKGTQRGTTSDIGGKYKVEAANGETLQFSFMGYKTKTIVLAEETNLNITLEESSHDLQEVVVTALGIKRETKTLPYATQNLSGSDVSTVRDNSSNVLSSLSGKVSGAVVTTAATGPGSAARVVLRGNRSISGNNSALIVIDGVPYDNSSPGQATGTSPSYGSSDGAANINPDDVESINVLKGPSAAALYGSRAANGAIVITTKQGNEGRFRIDYNGGVSFDQPNMLMDFQNTYGRGSGGVASNTLGESWGAATTAYKNNVKDFFNTAVSYNNSVSLYGGTKQIQGFASLTNNNIEGIVPGNELKRNTVNVRVNTNFHPKLTTDTKITYVNQQIDNKPRLGDAGTPLEAYIMPRDMSKDELKDYETINPVNGEPLRKYWTNSSIYDNPYWSTERTSVNEERNRVTLLFSAKYQLFDWLSILGRMSYDRYNDKLDGSFYDGTVSLGSVKAGGMYYETISENTERNFDFLISGENKLGDDFQFNYNVGGSTLKRTYSTRQDMANGLSIPNHFTLASARTPEFLNIGGFERKLNSFYGNLQIGYKGFLFLEATARNDWSSTLPSPHSYFYPSVGLSSVVTEMVKLPSWITFGKVRASYTQVGNDADPYLLQQRFRYNQGAGGGFVSREQDRSIGDLKPEKTKSFEVGLDWRFLYDRLSIDATFYKSNTINQLLFVGLPMASGYNRRYINAGDIQNVGFEMQISGKPVETKDFTWQTGINFSTNKNKVKELDAKTKQVEITANTKYASVIVKEGSAYGDLYGYTWAKHPDTGQYLVDDKGKPIRGKQEKIGNFNPDLLLGWSNNFSYKNFRMAFLIDGRIGGEMVSGTDAYLTYFGVSDATLTGRDGGMVLDAVRADGSPNTVGISAQDFWTTISQNGRDAWGEFYTYDMTNFRLREMSIGYDYKFKASDLVKSMQVSITGRNLFFIYKGKSKLNIPGMGKRSNPTDPDAALGAGNYQGVELGLPPISRTFGLNVKLSF